MIIFKLYSRKKGFKMGSFIGGLVMKVLCIMMVVLQSFGIDVSLLKKQPDS